MKKIFKITIFTLLHLAMGIQIVFSFAWMTGNIGIIPPFGDTAEYIQLSQTLQLDEYRTILYPLIIRVATWIEALTGMPMHSIIYVGQTVLCFLCMWYVVHTFVKLIGGAKWSKWREVFYALFFMSVPMITFLNFAILTDSVALSMLCLIVTQCVRIYNSDKLQIREIVMLFIAFLVEALGRADRVYSCGLFILVFCIIMLAKKKPWKMTVLSATVVLIVGILSFTVNSFTQTPGMYNRVKTSFAFVMLDRVVWPNMTANYNDFSDEIKINISLEEAQVFDSHNNQVMYYLAPLLEERVGHERAEEMYLEMARVVWENQSGKVTKDVLEDFAAFLLTPSTSYLTAKGKVETNNGWNMHCYSTQTPNIVDKYVKYYNILFGVVLFILATLTTIYRAVIRKEGELSRFLKIWFPYLMMCVVISLWFSLGDGAPPNDRYLLIGHMTWMMFIVWGMMPQFDQSDTKNQGEPVEDDTGASVDGTRNRERTNE